MVVLVLVWFGLVELEFIHVCIWTMDGQGKNRKNKQSGIKSCCATKTEHYSKVQHCLLDKFSKLRILNKYICVNFYPVNNLAGRREAGPGAARWQLSSNNSFSCPSVGHIPQLEYPAASKPTCSLA